MARPQPVEAAAVENKQRSGEFNVVCLLEPQDDVPEIGIKDIGVCRVLSRQPGEGLTGGPHSDDLAFSLDVGRTETGPEVDDLPFTAPR